MTQTATEFTNEDKAFDPTRLIHRIHSPVTDAEASRPDGRGFDCGCRSIKDYDPTSIGETFSELAKTGVGAIPVIGQIILSVNEGINWLTNKDLLHDFFKWLADTVEGELFSKFIGTVPQWVPVDRKNTDFQEVDREVEGRVSRSHQSCSDTPFYQWSHWYGWTFLIQPDQKLYRNVIGPGNTHTKDEIEELNASTRQWVFTDGIMDDKIACIMDCGSFYLPPRDFEDTADGSNGDNGRLRHPPGLMFDPKWPFWPQSGDYMWARGRFVYDCTHRTDNDPDSPNALMPTQIHPCRAIAWARRDTFQFDETEGFVPANRFMFFACRRGGYMNFETLKGEDIEFIVDLPTPKLLKRELDLGTTRRFPLNTIVLPPQLRIDLQFAPFGATDFPTVLDENGTTKTFKFASIEPFIEPIMPEDPNEPPRQVKVTIPMSQLADDDDGYGVMISMGWTDVDGSQAHRVKKITVRFDRIRIGDRDYGGNWRLNFCINGRWRHWGSNEIDDNESFLLLGPVELKPFTQFVPEDGFLRFSIQGHNRNGLGAIFEKSIQNRILTVGGLIKEDIPLIVNLQNEYKKLPEDIKKQLPFETFEKLPLDVIFGKSRVVHWNEDIDNKITGGDDKNTRASAVIRELSRSSFLELKSRNQPLGVLDRDVPDFSFASESGTVFVNPIDLSRLIRQMGQSGTRQASFTIGTRRSDLLTGTDTIYTLLNSMGGASDILDYNIEFTLTIEDQPAPQAQQNATSAD